MPNPHLKAGPGRPRGVPNKTTQVVKDLITRAFDEKGGLDAFVAWAKRNETEFYKIWARLLPLQLSGKDDGPIQTEQAGAAWEELARRLDNMAARLSAAGTDRG